MSRAIHTLVLQALLLGGVFLVCGMAPRAWAEAKIAEVAIRGNKKIESAAIRSKIQSQPATALNADLVRSDIRALFSLGFFEQIEVQEESTPQGVRLVFVVKEKPVVIKIDYKGMSELDKDDVKDALLVKEYEVFDTHKANQTIEKLLAKYEEKGFYLADIRYDTEVNEVRNEVKVTFTIEENDKVQVKEINIIGNKVVPDADLKAVMQTQEGGSLSFISGSGSYREALFDRDVANLGFYYGTLGYVRAKFGKPEVTVSPDKKYVYLTFSVEEGDKYFVGDVDFSGELLYDRGELLSELKLVKGEVFNANTLRLETLRYTDKYGDLGYAFANVVPQPNIHDDTKTVDINFEVDRGERVYIGSITVTGNTRTKDKVIRRELRIYEGQLFNGTRKRESRENILRLGFFDSVEFHQTTPKDHPNVVDIEIRVKERSTGQLVVGAGYASGNIGFTAQAQLSQNNFLGNGQVASLSAQVLTGQSFYEFNLGFTEPYVGSSLWSLGGDIYQLRRSIFTLTDVKTFDETKTGFDVKLGHPILDFTNLYLTYKLENSYIKPDSIIDNSLIPRNTVNGISSGITASVIYDKRDDRFDPREGLYWSASGEWAGAGGDRKYFKTLTNMKYFHPIVWDFIFRFNFQAGNITRIGDTPIPINELFIQGGLFTLRGYPNLSIGPRARLSTDPNVLSEDARKNNSAGKEIVLGGTNQVQANAEIEFPILKEAKIRGVLFFDAGNAFDGWFRNTSPALYSNYGFGFRWFTPIGPLRFEFGYPIVRGGSPQFYFTIGPPF